jgi:hypothetical protein
MLNCFTIIGDGVGATLAQIKYCTTTNNPPVYYSYTHRDAPKALTI